MTSPFRIHKSPHSLGAIEPQITAPEITPVVAPSESAASSANDVPGVPVLVSSLRETTRAVLEANFPDWKMRDGQKIAPRNTAANLVALMRLRGWTVRYNEMTHRPELTHDGALVPHDDDLNTSVTWLGDEAVKHGLERSTVPEFVAAAAKLNAYHPMRDWVLSVPWDRVDRREMLFQTLVLADQSKALLAQRLLSKWMLQGVGALMEPDGLSAVGMLVLQGPQHGGKTFWVRHLVPLPGAFAEALTLDPTDKDSVLRAIGVFIGELGELDGTMRKADIAHLKGFITSQCDEIRPPYGRQSAYYKRRTIFVGTVNGTAFLVDDTGNRRFWVIEVVRCEVLPADVMQQVWAQYMHMYQQGERWHLEPDLLQAINEANRNFETVDPLGEQIAGAFDWASVDVSDVTTENRIQHSDLVWKTATRVCQQAGLEFPNRSEATRASAIVKRLWERQCRQAVETVPSAEEIPHVTLFERRANGERLLAIPRKRASQA